MSFPVIFLTSMFLFTLSQTGAFDHLGMRALFEDPYHIEMARRDLTRKLVPLLPQVYNEVAEAFRGTLITSCAVKFDLLTA
jgi:hypothetical protein